MSGSLLRRSKRGVSPAVWTLRAEMPRDKEHPDIRRQKAITFRGTREEAEEALHRFVRSVKAGAKSDGQITVTELFEKWHDADSARQRPRAATTSHHDSLRFERWVKPRFGDTVVTALVPLDVQKFYEQARKDGPDGSIGLSPNSIVRIHALLAAMTRWGFRNQLIDKNPMVFVEKPRGEALPPTAPSIEAVQKLLKHLWESDRRMWLAVRLTSTLGLRRSEVLSIRWQDFLLGHVLQDEHGQLRIESGIVADPVSHKLIQTDTKGGAQSHRTLWLDRELTSEIRAILFQLNIPRQMGGYVFADDADNSKPWYPDTLNKKLSKARNEIPDARGLLPVCRTITFRSLRIFCASVIFADKLDVRTAKSVLGHASIETTDRYYIAFNDQQHRAATIAVGDRLARSPFEGVEY